ncbi:MAG: MBL fold metallo-hydrolase [Halieaceae bacterium]|jgi:L-ascorbate metabolism protein UlaG (beta-lactamase superfamily)|nr:MBL fold metallo-hydrolase [Halieaceae bacterium]
MRALKWMSIGLLVLLTVAVGWYLTRPGMADVGIPYANTPAAETRGVTVKWFGIATLLIDDGQTQIMTDGFFSRPGLLDILLRRPIAPELSAITGVIADHKINRLAAVIPVHSHYDHAMDSAEVAMQTGALLLGSNSTAHIARSSSLPESQIRIVETDRGYQFGRFTVTFYASRHAPLSTNAGIDGVVEKPFALPAPYTAWQLGEAYSILIEHPDGDMLVQGSAGYVPGALNGVTVNAVFLGTGGLRALPRDYQQAYIDEIVVSTKASDVYSIHHDNLFGQLGEVEQSKLLLEFDKMFAFELGQLVLPAKLLQLHYAQAVGL